MSWTATKTPGFETEFHKRLTQWPTSFFSPGPYALPRQTWTHGNYAVTEHRTDVGWNYRTSWGLAQYDTFEAAAGALAVRFAWAGAIEALISFAKQEAAS